MTENKQSGIAYHNSDIANKYMAEQLMGRNLNVYGFELPAVVRIEPTNLPEIEANELRLDNLFIFEDDSVGIVDYESDYEEADKIKYLNYVIRILRRPMKDIDKLLKVRMLVVYGTNVSKNSVNLRYNIGCLQFMIEAAFLEDLDSEDIIKIIDEKLTSNVALSNEELMKLMILPLTYRKDEDRKKAIRNAIELSKRIKDPKQMVSAITGILVFSDKFIEDEYSKEIRSWLNMTQVGRIINQEIQDAVEEAVTDLNKVIEEKDKQLESKNSLIEKLKAEVAKLGGNVAMF